MASAYFVPAGREPSREVLRKAAMVEAAPLLRQALEAMPVMAMVLNSRRQIVAANHVLLEVLGKSAVDVLSLRPGEAVGCVHSQQGEDGCGTGLHCTVCGAAQAIFDSQQTAKQVVRECRVLVRAAEGSQPMDLRVTVSPLLHAGEWYAIVAFEDIGQSKRLDVVQRSFFHDVLNTAGCLDGWVKVLARTTDSDARVVDKLSLLTGQLIDEINAHRELIAAEAGELLVQREPIALGKVLRALREAWSGHPLAAERQIVIAPIDDATCETDAGLLQRVLGNMIKNALEATPAGGTVTLAARDLGDYVSLAVHNREVMADEVQLQVFHRSFSTKGEPGRGVGTHSMKLLAERYLGGTVEFVSREGEGTTFQVSLPKRPPPLPPCVTGDFLDAAIDP